MACIELLSVLITNTDSFQIMSIISLLHGRSCNPNRKDQLEDVASRATVEDVSNFSVFRMHSVFSNR